MIQANNFCFVPIIKIRVTNQISATIKSLESIQNTRGYLGLNTYEPNDQNFLSDGEFLRLSKNEML